MVIRQQNYHFYCAYHLFLPYKVGISYITFGQPCGDRICLSGTRNQRPCAPGFLKLLWSAYRYACVCLVVCASAPRPLITGGVIWCDIDHVQFVKQVLQLFPAFNYFIQHLPSIKWMGVTILTQHVVNACQRKLR